MTTFKTFCLSTLTAASTLVFVALSTPAQACVSCGGIKLNGPLINGISLQGVTLQGVTLQGISLNGMKVNGAVSTRVASGHVVAVTLPR